jgi:hypothetical protein
MVNSVVCGACLSVALEAHVGKRDATLIGVAVIFAMGRLRDREDRQGDKEE